MVQKINIFYQLDKNFFGKPMNAFQKTSGKKAERYVDSISDFCKHFEDKAKKLKMSTPQTDTVEFSNTSIDEEIMEIFHI